MCSYEFYTTHVFCVTIFRKPFDYTRDYVIAPRQARRARMNNFVRRNILGNYFDDGTGVYGRCVSAQKVNLNWYFGDNNKAGKNWIRAKTLVSQNIAFTLGRVFLRIIYSCHRGLTTRGTCARTRTLESRQLPWQNDGFFYRSERFDIRGFLGFLGFRTKVRNTSCPRPSAV